MPAVPGPTQRQGRAVDQVLTGRLASRINADTMYVGDRAFPPLYLEGQDTGTYFRLSGNMRSAGNINIQMAVGAATPKVGFTPTSATWRCDPFGVAVPLPRVTAASSQMDRLDEVCQSRAYSEVMIARDVRLAAAMFVTGVWGNETTLGAAAQWDDAAGAPLQDLETAKRTALLASGKEPDTLILGYDSARVAKLNGDVTSLIPSAARTGIVSDDELADLLARKLGFKRLLIGSATRNTANEGVAETYGFIWTDNALVCYTGADGQGDGRELPAGGQIASTVGGAPTVVDRWYDDDAMSDYIRVREQRAWAFYDNAGGYLIINTAN